MADIKTKNLTIMFTDIKDFTPKTSKSSREQLKHILELHDSVIAPIFKQFDGKIVKTIGDAFMVTFHSPTDAVLCGIKIQDILEKHNHEAEEGDRLFIRVAINSGEVTMKGRDVFGEAVNIAARLEGIADAGDIYFTEAVYLAMNKSEIPTAEVGYKHFKGIPEEIKVYKVVREGKKGKASQLYKEVSSFSQQKIPTFLKVLMWIGGIVLALLILNVLKGLGLIILIVLGILWFFKWRKKS